MISIFGTKVGWGSMHLCFFFIFKDFSFFVMVFGMYVILYIIFSELFIQIIFKLISELYFGFSIKLFV